jgi:heme exporter protein B
VTAFLRVATAVARKDLRTELRSREMLPALGQFVVLALLIANFGFDVGTGGALIAPGVLWLTITFAGLVAFGRTFATERDQASLEPLLLTPASRAAIFAGKAFAAAAVLGACEVVLVPALGVFFNTPVLSLPLAGALVLATIGMAGLGCLFAALAAQTRARDLLLPVLALPLWIPFVIVGGRAVQVALGGGGEVNGALALLLDFDILFVVVASLAAKFVLDD